MKKEKKRRLRRIADRARRRREERHEIVVGKLTVTPGGFGFVALPPAPDGHPQEDVFIPPKFIGSAMDGDEVRVELIPQREEFRGERRGPAGRVVEVIDQARQEFVGELLPGNRVRPLNRRMPDDVEVSGARHGARRGDWVRVRLLRNEGGVWHGAINKVMGRAGVIAADLDAVVAEYDLAPPYRESDNEEALALQPREIAREDRTGELTVTIDPVDAKDFDDAVSIQPGKKESEVIVGVHISDVAAYIAPKSKFDRAAETRGFSCYLPGRTLPMLPAALTARISLRAGADSCAHSVYLTVDKASGKVLDFRRLHTKIRVDHRLNYEEVQTFIDTGRAPDGWSEALCGALRDLVAVTRRMREYRKATESFIDLALPEIRVLCSEADNRILGLSVKTARESENLVEECMLAANSAVGTELGQKSVAGLYRVHPAPDPEKIAEFSDLMEEAFGIVPGDLTDRKACNRFIAGLPDDPRRPVILSHLLRSLPRAYYLEKPALHFGLGKGRYSHFTSPIRRYPDLVAHQQLWNLDTHVRTRSVSTLARVAEECSEKEENNDAAYFAANDRLKLRYLQELLEKGGENMYEGVIAKVTSAGLQVDIHELGLYGFVPREQLRGDFRRSSRMLKQRRGEQGYKPGDFIYLRLAQIDFARGSAIFVPAGR